MIWAIYEFDLPFEIFGTKATTILGRYRHISRIWIALSCGTMIIGGEMLQNSMAPILTFNLSRESGYATETFPYIARGLVGFLMVLIPILLELWLEYSVKSKYRDSRYEKDVDKYFFSDSRLLYFFAFLGFGGNLFVSFMVEVVTVSILLGVFRKKKKSAKTMNSLVNTMEKKEIFERGIFKGWLKAGKSDVSRWMSFALAPIFFISVFNFGFIEPWNPLQLLFVTLFFFSVFVIYLIIKYEKDQWAYSVLILLPITAAFVLAHYYPSAMPYAAFIMEIPPPPTMSHLINISRGHFLVQVFWMACYFLLLISFFVAQSEKAMAQRRIKSFRKWTRCFQMSMAIFGSFFLWALRTGMRGYHVVSPIQLVPFIIVFVSIIAVLELWMHREIKTFEVE